MDHLLLALKCLLAVFSNQTIVKTARHYEEKSIPAQNMFSSTSQFWNFSIGGGRSCHGIKSKAVKCIKSQPVQSCYCAETNNNLNPCFQHSLSCFKFHVQGSTITRATWPVHVCWKYHTFVHAYRMFTQDPHVSPVPCCTSEPLLPQHNWLSSSWNETRARRRIPNVMKAA